MPSLLALIKHVSYPLLLELVGWALYSTSRVLSAVDCAFPVRGLLLLVITLWHQHAHPMAM